MFNTPIKIGPYETRSRVFFAPLAGYTNYPFRRLCKEYGAGLCYTEMVSAKALSYGDKKTRTLLASIPNAKVNGDEAHRLPNTVNISFEAVEGEALLLQMDQYKMIGNAVPPAMSKILAEAIWELLFKEA